MKSTEATILMLIGLGVIIVAWPILKDVPPEIANITQIVGQVTLLDSSWQAVLVGVGVIVIGLLAMVATNSWRNRIKKEDD